MSTLNIKNFPDALYAKLEARARYEHRSVAQEVIHLLTQATERPTRRSLLEMRGLGKEAWRDINAAKHVRTERDAWD
jgi:plasmid stability protein